MTLTGQPCSLTHTRRSHTRMYTNIIDSTQISREICRSWTPEAGIESVNRRRTRKLSYCAIVTIFVRQTVLNHWVFRQWEFISLRRVGTIGALLLWICLPFYLWCLHIYIQFKFWVEVATSRSFECKQFHSSSNSKLYWGIQATAGTKQIK